MTANQAHDKLNAAIHALALLARTWRTLGLEADAARADQAMDALILELNWLRTEVGLRPMTRT